MRKYLDVSRSTLEMWLRVMSAPLLRWVFADQIADIEHELMMRDMEALAEDCDGFPCAPASGWN